MHNKPLIFKNYLFIIKVKKFNKNVKYIRKTVIEENFKFLISIF